MLFKKFLNNDKLSISFDLISFFLNIDHIKILIIEIILHVVRDELFIDDESSIFNFQQHFRIRRELSLNTYIISSSKDFIKTLQTRDTDLTCFFEREYFFLCSLFFNELEMTVHLSLFNV